MAVSVDAAEVSEFVPVVPVIGIVVVELPPLRQLFAALADAQRDICPYSPAVWALLDRLNVRKRLLSGAVPQRARAERCPSVSRTTSMQTAYYLQGRARRNVDRPRHRVTGLSRKLLDLRKGAYMSITGLQQQTN